MTGPHWSTTNPEERYTGRHRLSRWRAELVILLGAVLALALIVGVAFLLP